MRSEPDFAAIIALGAKTRRTRNMKTPWTKIFAAAAIVCAAPANAIPVTFDFSGTVAQVVVTDFTTGVGVTTFDLSTAGQAFSAQFIVDTDLFAPVTLLPPPDVGNRLGFSTELPGAITSNFLINGEALDATPFNQDRSTVNFLDSLGVVSCGELCSRLAPDQLNVGIFSVNSTPFGVTAFRALGFGFSASFASFDNPEPAMSWFDFSPDFDITKLASLPLLDSLRANVSLTEGLFDCAELPCRQTASHRTVFNVTSASRTVSSVPEPGALGLLAIGLAGAWFTRRRQPQRV